MINTVIRPTLLAVVVVGASILTAQADLVLAENSKALPEIVVPAEASLTVQHAAEELARYLNQITGATFCTVTEDQRPGILTLDVGPTRRAKEHWDGELSGNKEAVCITVDKAGAILYGGSDRGTLFAVYRFLEILGCRWLTHDTEFVPQAATLSAAFTDTQSAPAFDMRAFCWLTDSSMSWDWGVKNGLNGFYGKKEARLNGNCYYFHEALWSPHVWYKLIPPDKYFESHPEWFPFRDGRRQPSQQLCVTAPGLIDEFAANLMAIMDQDPGCDLVSISPNDGYGWCECDACTALDKDLCGTSTKLGDRVFWFSNQIAERVARKYPDKKLLVLAYINYLEAPATIRPHRNVIPWLCHYDPADYSRAINDPTSKDNAKFDKILKEWADSTPHLLFYAYVSKSMWWDLPRPVLRPFAEDVKYFHSLGLSRYYFQSLLDNWPLDGPLYYVLAKLLWDPKQDPQVLTRDWVNHMFGEAAEPMMQFYQAVDDSVRNTGKSYRDDPPRQVPGLYRREDLDRARAALEEALAASNEDVIKERIVRVQKQFLYGYYAVKAIESAEAYKKNGRKKTLEEASKHAGQALQYGFHKHSKGYLNGLAIAQAFGAVARRIGESEEKGGRTCWNADETGPGDNRFGAMQVFLPVNNPSRMVLVHVDIWGESDGFNYLQIGRNTLSTTMKTSGKSQWETITFEVPSRMMDRKKKVQEFRFGDTDAQNWIARIHTGQYDKKK